MSIRIDAEKFDKIYLLFSNDGEWELSRTTQHHHGAVPQKNSLEDRIKCILAGSEIDAEIFARVRMQLEYENYLSKDRREHRHALDFLHLLNFFGIRLSAYTGEIKRWISARTELENLLDETSCQERYQAQDVVRVKGDTILKLRDWGYKIPIIQGLIQQDAEDVGRFADSMRYNFDQLGGVSVLIVLQHMERFFSDTMGRYMFHRSPGMFETPRLAVPWGYLFNVALSYWTKERKLTERKAAQVFNRISDVATSFIATIELQPLSIFEEMLRSSRTSMVELQEAIMYEQHYGIDQLRPDYMLTVLQGLISQRRPDRIAEIFAEILKWVCKQNARLNPVCFTLGKLIDELGTNSYSCSEIREALDLLSQDAGDLNTGCANPFDATTRNYFKHPFVANGDKYYLIAPVFFAKAFYHAWKERPHDKSEDLGKMFEHCVADLFAAHGVAFRGNVKYKVPATRRSVLQGRADGECDFVIETDSSICFIEMKNKEITAEAMSGDPASALTDMASSALHGLSQAAIAEYCLRVDGNLNFDDGSVLELKQRRVEKIHLSSFDHYGLHDNVLLLRYLQAMLTIDYSCSEREDTKAWKDFKKHQQEFRNVVGTDIMRSAYVNQNARLMSFHSFSLPQFMTIMESVKSADDFVAEMRVTAHLSTGAKDWYHDYAFAKDIRER